MAETEGQIEIGKYIYISKPDHRDGTSTKSQWTISTNDERACFALGVNREWIRGQCAWGLHVVNGAAGYLGRTASDRSPSDDLIVAFFQLADVCHGYPSDPKRSVREVPPSSVTRDWLGKGYLRSSVVRKLQRGLTCKL
jgi:hypothetical protein